MDIDEIIAEVMDYLNSVNVGEDGNHLHSNYQEVVAMTVRLQQIHNDIAEAEIRGTADPALRKLRTMIIDPTIERLDKVAQFESRKITSRSLEFELERKR